MLGKASLLVPELLTLGVVAYVMAGLPRAPELRTLARPPEPRSATADELVFRSRAECESVIAGGGRLARPQSSARIVGWNVRWFPDGTADPDEPSGRRTDLAWLSCALTWLDADVIAVQEFRAHDRGRMAREALTRWLDARTGGRWQIALDDCGDDDSSHVGFVYDTARVSANGAAPAKWGCKGDLQRAYSRYFRFPGGLDLHLASLHLQWGTEQGQFDERRRADRALGQGWRRLQKSIADADLVVIGDFNTSGCSECEPALSAEAERAALGSLLGRTSPGFRLLNVEPACTEYHGGVPSAIDHAAVHGGMRELPEAVRVQVYGPCRAMACRHGPGGKDPPEYARYFVDLSDHCPIALTLPDRDND